MRYTRNIANTYLSVLIFKAANELNELNLAMKNWEEEQRYQKNWKLSGGSDRKEVQWVLAKYKGDEAEAAKLEDGIIENQPGSYFSILLRTLSLLSK